MKQIGQRPGYYISSCRTVSTKQVGEEAFVVTSRSEMERQIFVENIVNFNEYRIIIEIDNINLISKYYQLSSDKLFGWSLDENTYFELALEQTSEQENVVKGLILKNKSFDAITAYE